MKSFHRLFNERKRNNMIAAALMAAAVFTFSGCSTGTAADNGASSSVAQQTAANQANLSDARNTRLSVRLRWSARRWSVLRIRPWRGIGSIILWRRRASVLV